MSSRPGSGSQRAQPGCHPVGNPNRTVAAEIKVGWCPLSLRDNETDFAQRDGRLESPEVTDVADVTPFIVPFSLGCDLPLIFDTNATYQIDERKIARHSRLAAAPPVVCAGLNTLRVI